MVGFVQLFFITFLLFYQPEGADPVVSQPLQGTEAMARPSRLKWTNETQVLKGRKTKRSKIAVAFSSIFHRAGLSSSSHIPTIA
ncbi:hypothetical protein NKJ35_08455 [Mesorhizobium sp. M0136]|uniref:hypothetical protein n=1 Tax=unclassified Mesorhizobium TaxID=325217 RepID=UPI0033378204